MQAGNRWMLSMLDLPQVIGRLHCQPHARIAQTCKLKAECKVRGDTGVPVDDGRQLSAGITKMLRQRTDGHADRRQYVFAQRFPGMRRIMQRHRAAS
ncbi:hypothetical protein G6F62_015770 [Rhizopus arrhizus]|nr:hypothetical protein G6F62_015770 [Rhizopus arrhizus]